MNEQTLRRTDVATNGRCDERTNQPLEKATRRAMLIYLTPDFRPKPGKYEKCVGMNASWNENEKCDEKTQERSTLKTERWTDGPRNGPRNGQTVARRGVARKAFLDEAVYRLSLALRTEDRRPTKQTEDP